MAFCFGVRAAGTGRDSPSARPATQGHPAVAATCHTPQQPTAERSPYVQLLDASPQPQEAVAKAVVPRALNLDGATDCTALD